MSPQRYDFGSILETSFLVLIFSLGFMQPNLVVGGYPIPASDLIFLTVGGIWVVGLNFRRVEFRFDKSYLILALYFTGLLLSAVFSEQPGSSLFKLVGETYLIGLAVMASNLVRTSGMLKKVVLVWIGASATVAVIGTLTVIFFYLGLTNVVTEFSSHHYGSLPPGNYVRLQGTFLFPSILCNYLTASLLMLLAGKKLGWVGHPVFFLVSLLFSITILFTVTPGIGGALLAVSFWYWLISKRDNRPYLPKMVLAGGVIAAAAFLIVSTFSLIASPTSPYFFSLAGIRIDPSQRLLTWQGAFHTFLQNPFFGKGLGLGVAEVYFMPPSGQIQLLTDAHNTFLNVAGQAGLFGILPLFAVCTVVIFRLRQIKIGVSEISLVRLCLGIAFITAFLYQGLVGSFENTRHLWVLIGLILAAARLSDGGSQTAGVIS
ncbi:MAG: O-antigen ligase family protein [Pyrinomonadaceae bacterium]